MSAQKLVRTYPGWSAALLSAAGYLILGGTLYSDLLAGIYPSVGLPVVNLLSHLIALNNTVAVVLLGLGWWWILQGDVRKHPRAMGAAFALILVFLVLYLLKTGGGGRKEFVGPSAAHVIYLSLLLIHILLSIVSIPLVLYTLLVALSQPLGRVSQTVHPRVGRWAASCWIVSLVLGIVAYLMLNHLYGYHFVAR